MANNFKYVLGFFLSGLGTKSIQKIVSVAEAIASFYGVTCSEFGFINEENGKRKTRKSKYSPKNLKKLLDANPKDISYIFFEKFKDKKDYLNAEFSFGFLNSTDNDYPIIVKIIIDPALVSNEFNNKDLTKIINQIDLLNLRLEYGIAFFMETKKMPLYFLTGVQTPELSREEREIANALALNIRQYKNKIWDIFWFNIVKKEIIKTNLLDKIKQIVSEKNVAEVGDKYIISVPLKHNQHDNQQIMVDEQCKAKLRQIFLEKELMMYNYLG